MRLFEAMVPNCISLLRLLLGVLVLGLFPYVPLTTSYLLGILALMTCAEISDVCDGYVARRFDQESPLGRLLDPMVDSVYRFFVFLSFVTLGWMEAWVCGVFFLNYVLTSYLRGFASVFGVEFVGARISGKVKSFFQGCVQLLIVMLYILYEEGYMDLGTWILYRDVMIGVAVLLTLVASVDYVYSFYGLVLKRGGVGLSGKVV